ncbi:unnamed protein product [Periconia digitata]|uniref:Uncharacterized protein n=1 Tax=Periconia digitata TaxID=1303443 RepID=A0A9W4UMY2_9PLEO|nr:unnamed protein product [Periconia digitata]
MPPRKEKVAKDGDDFKHLMESFSIKFEGPVPPKQWPPLYSHHFAVIRNIFSTRYDDYMAQTDVDAKRKEVQRKRVEKLRRIAYGLRPDLHINESTWRAKVEPVVIEIFEERVICPFCGDEKHVPDHMAVPYDSNTKKVLKSKRRTRKRCECQREGTDIVDGDDEAQDMFKYLTEEVVKHSNTNEHDNYLKTRNIPMKPDGIVGLNITPGIRDCLSRCQWSLENKPLNGKDMIYPFLVIEAKKAIHPPGFRSIERQTAFPIRRFLHIQDELRNKSLDYCYEPPLVWFFAYQGEEWRLYAGVLPSREMSVAGSIDEKEKLSVYDLWHGTIESEDGALQLLQIVDYIWTWARDIFRPQVKACLIGEARRRQSESLPISRQGSYVTRCLDASYQAEPTDTIMSDVIETTEEIRLVASGSTSPERFSTPIHESDDTPILANSEVIADAPFSRWATAHMCSEKFSSFATIRHANDINYSFRIRDVQNVHHFVDGKASAHQLESRLELFSLKKLAIRIQTRDLYQLVRYWTSKNQVVDNTEDNMSVTLLYRTYCRPRDWQIFRQIQCIIWPKDLYQPQADDRANERTHELYKQAPVPIDQLLSSVTQLRSLSGKHSVYSACHDFCFLFYRFNTIADWGPPIDFGIEPSTMKMCTDLLDDDLLFPNNLNQVERTCMLHEDYTNTQILQFKLGDVPNWQEAVVVEKPDYWPSESPKFCLFVLLQEGYDDQNALAKLLRDECVRRKFYQLGGPSSADRRDKSDGPRLRAWHDWLKTLDIRAYVRDGSKDPREYSRFLTH